MKTAMKTDERLNRPSASGLARLIACPASWQAEKAAPAADNTTAAAKGTELHAHMEHGTNPEDPEEQEAVAWCREKQIELADAYLGEGHRVLMREKRLWHYVNLNTPSYSGKADIIFASADHRKYLIIDYKFGRTAVDSAASNIQLAALASLLYFNTASNKDIEIYAAILQPWVTRTPEITRYVESDLQRAVAAIENAIAAAEAEEPPLRASATACRYCPAATACPAAVRETLTLRAMQFWPTLSAEQKRNMYDRAQQCKHQIELVEAACRKDLLDGISIPGLTITNGKKQFSIKNPTAAFRALEPIGISAEEFAACCSLPIGKLEKLFLAKQKARAAEAGRTITEKESREMLEKLLAHCAETTTTKGSLKAR